MAHLVGFKEDIRIVTRTSLIHGGALVLLAALILAAALGRAAAAPAQRAAEPARPNVIVIQTDDQSMLTLRSRFRDPWDVHRRTMPRTLDLLAGQGVEFTNYYVSNPLCSPSRASLLSGQYAHTSGYRRNAGADGGWTGWQNLPVNSQNLAVALQRAGYRTAHIGKFVNGYHGATRETFEPTVPPGWDHWYTPIYGDILYYYGYTMNRNGTETGPYGSNGYDMWGTVTDPDHCTPASLLRPVAGEPCNHSTDVFSRDAVDQIQRSDNRPFYIQVDYNTPHGDHRSPIGPEPLTRHYDSALKTVMPRPRGFNEPDVSDKPSFVRDLPPMSRGEMEQLGVRWRKDLESLRGVDDGVGAIVQALRRTGKLSNTYIFFTSDNGQFQGEHRMSSAKFLAYEPAANVPLLVRGPGIRPGTRSHELVANIDLAPTILGLTGARMPWGFDGRSMERFWKNPEWRSRRPVVLEGFSGPIDVPPIDAGTSAPAPARNFAGLRVGRYKYVEHSNGERELYDLVSDPAELRNRIGDPAWRRIAVRLSRDLSARRSCRGAACRAPVARLPLPPHVVKKLRAIRQAKKRRAIRQAKRRQAKRQQARREAQRRAAGRR